MRQTKMIVNNNPGNIDFLDIGNGCNFQCPGCYYTKKPNSTKVTKQEERSLIEKIVQDYPGAWFFLYPKEITTSPYLLDLIKSAGQKIKLTNAFLLDDRMVDRFKEAGLKYVKVTFFAREEEQKWWQSIDKQKYLTIRRNIENAVQNGLTVMVNNVLWKSNIGSIVDLSQQCYDMGVERIKFIRLRGPTWSNEYITDEDMSNVVEEIEKAKLQRSPRLNFSLTFAGPNFYNKTLEEARGKLPPKEGEWVRGPYFCPAINGNYWGISLKRGKVYWCYFITDDPIAEIGTVNKETGKISISPTVDLRPETLKEKLRGICSQDNCEYQSVCLGGCRTTAYLFAKMRGEEDPLYAGMDTCLTKVYERVLGKR